MAKSVLELAVGTGQWDAGLKKAKSALDNFTQSQGGLQQALAKDSENIRKFVSMMGQTESTAKTAKGQMNDYKATIEQLTMQYNRMTDAQKKSIGQDYIQSIDQLKQKYQAVNEEIQEMNRSLNNVKDPDIADGAKAGGLFGGGKLDGMLQVFGGNLMTKASEAVVRLGSEMYGMVQQGVEMARQGEGVRIAFERLGRGDILDGLRQATHGTVTDLELMKAAVKFNDFKLPLDELGTMLAFAQQKAKDTGQSVDYMVDSIVTGLGRKSLMILDNLGLSASEIKERMKETGDMTKAVGAIIRDQMKNAGDYVETAADRAAQANVSLQNKMEELGRKFAPIEESSNQLWTSMKIGILDIVGGPLARLLNGLTEAGRLKNMLNDLNGEPGSGNTKVDQQLKKLNAIKKGGGSDNYFNTTLSGMVEDYNRQITALDAQIKNGGKKPGAGSGESQSIRYLQKQMNALQIMRDQLKAGAKEIVNTNNTTNAGSGTTVKTPKPGKSTKTEQTELQKNQEKINTLTQQFVDINAEASRAGKPLTEEQKKQTEEIQKQIEKLKERNALLGLFAEQAQGRLTLGAGDFQMVGLNKTPGTLLKAPTTAVYEDGVMTEKAVPSGGLQLDDKAMKAVQKSIDMQLKDVDGLADKWGSVSSAIGAVGNAMAAIEDPAAKILGIVAQAIATVALTFAKSLEKTFTPWDWIAAAAAGTATMISTISAIHSATGYAEGGMIKGNSYSGDNLMAMGPNGSLIGLNAGEIVLNKSQQATLAQNLQGGGMQNLNLTATIKGEQIRLALNNNGRRTGRGEYVQSRNVR